MKISKKELQAYVNAATDLAEAIHRDVSKNKGKVSDATIAALNKYTTVMNEIVDFKQTLDKDKDGNTIN